MSDTSLARHHFFELLGRLAEKTYSGSPAFPHDHIPFLLSKEGIRPDVHSQVLVRDKKPTKQELSEIFQAEGYEILVTESYLGFMKFGESKFSPMVMIEWWTYRGTFHISGEHTAVAQAIALVEKHWPNEHFGVRLASRIGSQGIVGTSRMVSYQRKALQSFYPFLDRPMEQFFDEYLASPANILLLIGPPGTGKTSFLRALILHQKLKTMVAYNKQVIESPELYDEVASDDYGLLALEDADNFVVTREQENPFMSALLNDSQGVADASNIKIVISTNLQSVNRVDSALIRPGRCFKVLEFRELTPSEIHKVWEDVGMPPHPINALRGKTLSEVLNPEEYSPKVQKTGFGA